MRDNISYTEGEKIVMHAMDRLRMVGLSEYSVFLYLIYLCRCKLFTDFKCTYFRKESISSNINRILFNSDIDNREILIDLFKVFDGDITKLDSYNDSSMLDIIDQLMQIPDEWYNNYYVTIFEELLVKIYSFQNKEQVVQPVEITKFISELSDYNNSSIVYNPFAGSASYGVEMKANSGYFGEEINEKTWAIGTLRLIAHDKSPHNFTCQNSIFSWRAKYHEKEYNKPLYDFIIATPPFGSPVPNKEYWIEPFKRQCSCEDFFIARGIEGLTPKGKLIGLFSAGVLFRGGASEQERKKAVDNDYLEMVINLPANLLYNTPIPTVILVLCKNKELHNTIKIVDGSTFIEKKERANVLSYKQLISCINANDSQYVRYVPKEEIIENNYNLSVSRYFAEKIDKIIIPRGYTLKKLSDLTTVYRGKRNNIKTSGRTVKIADLASDPFNYERNSSDFEIGDIQSSCQKISSDVLLLSKIRSLKPTYCFASKNSSFYTSNNITALVVDNSQIDIAYLIHELNSDKVSKYVTSRLTGVTILSISVKDLLATPILLPPIEEQKAIVIRDLEISQMAKVKELGLENLISIEKDRYKSIISTKKHRIRPYLSGIGDNLDLLIEQFQENNFIVNYSDEINPGYAVSDLLKNMQLCISEVKNLFNELTKETIIGDKEVFNIREFIDNYYYDHKKNDNDFQIVKVYNEDSFIIENDEDNKLNIQPFIKFNKGNLKELIDLIIENAERHAFIDKNQIRNEVVIEISLADSAYILLSIKNNGIPMPKDFSEELFFANGIHQGETGNTGVGGFRIREIAESLDSKVHLINEPQSIYPVDLHIYLPINQ